MKKKAGLNCLLMFLGMMVAILLYPVASQADTGNPFTGTYYGTATVTSPAVLGNIDLAFYLDVGAGGAFEKSNSFIVLEKTLLFPAVAPQVGDEDVGPRVAGSINLTAFTLTTDSFSSTVPGRTVSRIVQLLNGKVTNNGNTIAGDYRETITGFQNPVVVTGTFILVRPVVPLGGVLKDDDGNGCFDLADIRKSGSNPNVIEYDDIAYALYLFYNPAQVPNICTSQADIGCPSRDCIVQKALYEYHQTLK